MSDHFKLPPRPTAGAVQEAVNELYGISAVANPLPGEQDYNYRLKDSSGEEFVFKISPSLTGDSSIRIQNRVLGCLNSDRVVDTDPVELPRVVPSLRGRKIEGFGPRNNPLLCRLLTYLPGRPIADVKPCSRELLLEVGRILGDLDTRLAGIHLPEIGEAEFEWDLRRAGRVIEENLDYIRQPERKDLLKRALDRYLPILESLRKSLRISLIHNDANDYNIMVLGNDPQDLRIGGLIDFGDLARTWTVSEPAIAAAYLMAGQPDPIESAAVLVAGYDSAHPLNDEELAVLFPLSCLRAALSVSLSSRKIMEQPENDYLLISAAPFWKLLARSEGIHPRLAEYRIREACGREPCPASAALVSRLKSKHLDFVSPVPVDLKSAPGVLFDLDVGSVFQNRIFGKEMPAFGENWPEVAREAGMSGSSTGGARPDYLLARYNEARAVLPDFRFDPESPGDREKKNIHLGIDIFMPPGTPVFAPLAGMVHSCEENAGPLGRGATLILTHEFESENEFYTLYGNLGKETVSYLIEGLEVTGGSRIGEIAESGVPEDFPPCLHFQVVVDLLDHKAGFPWTSVPSQRKTWCSISPDPNLLLGIPEKYLVSSRKEPKEILQFRERQLGRSLSLAYRRPLKIVRGWRQYLFDHEGRQYLDCVNNVCHVGHSHPDVVRAGMNQALVLNTNTRYLHDNLVEYVEMLLARFPAPLDTCFLVCSGSEANELALRLARAYTGARDIVALEAAYHGNTGTLIDISSYKHDGPGGSGAPEWVHLVPLPDGYRGRFRGRGTEIGRAYAETVEEKLMSMERKSIRPAAFICESLPGCAGQIVLPEGYLQKVYHSVRTRGGVTIADEVQTGFGRVGSAFWGFELQGVVPDIVTLGKPIGNGHPMGAVITTAEIADAFANGMEYFNTFGGNPVSCAIGKAVLEVIDRERLQDRTAETGEFLLASLAGLRDNHPLVGDVRGKGLFLGIELVLDRHSREPASHQADYIVNRLREWGFLLSTDGSSGNVLKIKPPLPFSIDNARQLSRALDLLLKEIRNLGW